MIMCVLLCYPVSIRIYYQQGVLFLVILRMFLRKILRIRMSVKTGSDSFICFRNDP